MAATAGTLRSASGDTTQQALISRYLEVRRATDALCQPLAIEDYGLQAMPDTSPPK